MAKLQYRIIQILIMSTILFSCDSSPSSQSGKEKAEHSLPAVNFDLPQILQRDTLLALTSYSSTSYFIYKGQPMGYEFELLSRLAEHLGVELKIIPVKDMDGLFNLLNEGKGDLIAYNMTITLSRQKTVDFTVPHSITRQVLVQKLPDNWLKLKKHQIDKILIRNVLDLIGNDVYVRKNTSYYSRLVNLSNEIGGWINIKELPGTVTTEESIGMVRDGKIPRTVSDLNVAKINKTYYPEIDIETPVSFPQRVAWAVRKNSPEFLEAVNNWLTEIKKTNDYYTIYNKYFKNTKRQKRIFKSKYKFDKSGKLSPYDKLIKKYSKVMGWDWLFFASQIYQESKFNPRAKSWMGAHGLLQLVPKTARHFGAENSSDPNQNLKAGSAYLKWLQDYWREIPDSLERIKFVLASFNTGQNHVRDAQKLAKKYGENDKSWAVIANYLQKLAKKEYFTDPVVNYGYCRGEEPVSYVKEIFDRYRIYKQFLRD